MSSHDSGTPTPDRLPPESGGNSGDSGSKNPIPNNELPRWATKQSTNTPFSEARMAAYIGPRWESTYRAKLAQFFADPSFNVTWNWAAALGSPFWFLYRKLYMTALIFCTLPNLALSLLVTNVDETTFANPQSPEAIRYYMMMGAVALSTSIAAGGTANWFLFRRARAASYVVLMQQVPEDVAITRLQRLGGVSVRAVVIFCAVSLLIAMVISKPGAL